MSLTLTNRKPIPLGRVKIEDQIPEIIEIADAPVVGSHDPESQNLCHSTSMAWYERIHWEYQIKCPRRGFYRLGPTKISSGDLLGIFAAQGLVIGFGVMGLLVAGLSWLWNRVSLEEVSYERKLSQQRVFIDEEVCNA